MSFLPQKILIIQTAFIGDVILTLPVVQCLKEQFPAAKIDFLAIPSSQNILESHPAIDPPIIYDKHGADGGIRAFLRLAKKLQQKQYDLVVTPHRSMRSAVLSWRTGASIRIGFDRSAASFLFTHVITYPKSMHEIHRNLSLLQPLGINPAAPPLPEIVATEEDHRAVSQWRSAWKIPKSNTVCIAPGSVWATKRWLPERFAAVAKGLAEHGYQVILIGGSDDVETADEVIKMADHNGVHNAVGKFTLRQSHLLIQQSDLLITNDSAPMHLGVAARTPVIAIYGATVPAQGFYPLGDRHRVIEDGSLQCRPCGSHGGHKCPIGTFECMRNISGETVMEAALQILEHRNDG